MNERKCQSEIERWEKTGIYHGDFIQKLTKHEGFTAFAREEDEG